MSNVDYKQASDQELLKCCRKDDIKAYNELFRRHSDRLYRQAARYVLDDGVAEELMLDLLFDLWDKRQERRISGELSAYLYRCMRNKIVDYRRRAIPVTIVIEHAGLAETLEEHKQADYGLMAADADSMYEDVLEAMSPQRRKVFQLSREGELTYSQIASEMNLSVKTVEHYMSSALDTFRKRTKGYLSATNRILYLILIGYSLL